LEETAGSGDGAGLVAPPGEEGGAARVVMSTVLVVTAPSVTLALVGSGGLEGAGECFRATARGATVLAREQQRAGAGAGGVGADGVGGEAAGGSTLSDVRVSVADLWADHAADGAGREGGRLERLLRFGGRAEELLPGGLPRDWGDGWKRKAPPLHAPSFSDCRHPIEWLDPKGGAR